ncbi:hypothetical protein ACFCWV_11030 [Streptomyces sp. NPDC056341]|uniref:hypothetical protein n=1 Tax=Streptomyces sp. NPDC056341 TaxID=3345788 RepID=UPI0035E0C06E
MIRIVTRKRLALLEADTHAAFERARQSSEAASEATVRHERELADATDRAERAEATTEEVSALLSHAVKEASTAEQRSLLDQIEVRRLREEIAEAREPGRSLFLLLHFGTPRMIYRSREDAVADTATHGIPADHTWGPASPFWFDAEWVLAPFTHDKASGGFRGSLTPTAVSLGGAA